MKIPRFSAPIRKGVCLAGCSLFLVPFMLELGHVFMSARYVSRKTTCLANMKDISGALLQYCQDWDETFPPAAHWARSAVQHIQPEEISRAFHCPEAPSPYSYVFNRRLDRQRLEDLESPAATVAIYEAAVSEFNAAGDGITIPVANWHYGGSNFAFTDGHVKRNNASVIKELIWHNSVPQHNPSKP